MKVPWRIEFSEGLGFQTSTYQITATAVNSDQPGTAVPVMSTRVEYLLVHDIDSYVKLWQLSSDVGLSFQGIGGSLYSNLSKKLEVSRNSLQALVVASMTSGPVGWAPDKTTLTQAARNKLANEGPDAFRQEYGDRYIAGHTLGMCYVGGYNLMFQNTDTRSSVKAGLSAAITGAASGGASISSILQQYSSSYTCSWLTEDQGWPSGMSSNISAGSDGPQQLPQLLRDVQAAVDTAKKNSKAGNPDGVRTQALLRKFTELEDYRSALAEYKNTWWGWFNKWWGWLTKPLLKSAQQTAGQGSSYEQALEHISKEYFELEYLQKIVKPTSDPQHEQQLTTFCAEIEAVMDKMREAFQDSANVAKLATVIKSPDQPLAGSEQQWQDGKRLQMEFFRSATFKKSLQSILQAVAGENVSEWFGDTVRGTYVYFKFNSSEDKDPLRLSFVEPSKQGPWGRYCISHLEHAANKPVFGSLGWDPAAKGFARMAVWHSIFTPGWFAIPFWRQGNRELFSNLEVRQVPKADLADVREVWVWHGDVVRPDGSNMKVVGQVKLTSSSGASIRIPDCKQHWLFQGCYTTRTRVPPEGQQGTVTAVSGQGHALRFHWVPEV